VLLKSIVELLLSLSPLARALCVVGLVASVLVVCFTVLVVVLIVAFSPEGVGRLSLILSLLPWPRRSQRNLPSHLAKSRRMPHVRHGRHR
jgi:hypothetical protein